GASSANAYIVADQDLAGMCPAVSVADTSGAEGGALSGKLQFSVTLAAPTDVPVSVGYATTGGTAVAGSDYSSRSGTLSFAPGETAKVIAVPLIGDTTIEPDETLGVRLSNPVGVRIARADAVGTVLNDDTPRISIADVAKPEGNSGTTAYAFTVTLNQANTA